MAGTLEKSRTEALSVPSPYVSAEQYENHQCELAALRAKQEANRELMLNCLDPAFAAKLELEKPRWKFRVRARWTGIGEDGRTRFSGDETVVAQNESEAWALFCDKLQTWPSRRNCQQLDFEKLEQVSVTQFVSGVESSTPIPEVNLSPKKRKASL